MGESSEWPVRNKGRIFSMSMLPEFVVITIAAGFVISVIYDWGFAFALDFDISLLPMTTADHFRTGAIWFPKLIACVILAVAFEFYFQRLERGFTEDEIVRNSKDPEATRRMRERPNRFLEWISPIGILLYVITGNSVIVSLMPYLISITWVSFASWCNSTPLIKLRRTEESRIAFFYLPIIFIIAFFSGYSAAISATMSEKNQVNIIRT